MHSTESILDCTPAVFFENHVDFEHFSTIHQGYSDPELIDVSWALNEFTAQYSLLYDKQVKQKLIYRYSVQIQSRDDWNGTIETTSFGMNCCIKFSCQRLGDQVKLLITASACAPWMTANAAEKASKHLLQQYLVDFTADANEINGKTGRFPKPILSEEDFALREFRKFVESNQY